MIPLPPGPFATVLMDPPWSFMTYNGAKVPQRAEQQHYATMTLDELRAIPVKDACTKDAVLLMWVIDSHLDQALELGRALGFTYKTKAITWVKIGADGRPIMGMGKWTRKETEMVLLFTRGKPKRLSGGVRETIFAPRREHSRKPDEQYERIEALVAGPYLEMFARRARPGWSVWGDQAPVETVSVRLQRLVEAFG